MTNTIANVAPFQRGMRTMRTESSKTQKTMGALRSAALQLGGTLAVVGFFKKAVTAASDAEEIMSKFSVVFGENAEAAKAWSDSIADSFGKGRTETARFFAEAQDLFVPLGFASGTAQDLSKNVVRLAFDLASFNNMRPEEAFERISGALVGNHENARRFGVVLNEMTLKEELARIGADKYTGSMLEQAKVQARLNILVKGTTAAQGDALRTADSFKNSMERLDAQFTEFTEHVGKGSIPVLSAYMGNLAEFLTLTNDIIDAYGAVNAVEEKRQKLIDKAKTQKLGDIDLLSPKARRELGGQVAELENTAAAIGEVLKSVKSPGAVKRIFARRGISELELDGRKLDAADVARTSRQRLAKEQETLTDLANKNRQVLQGTRETFDRDQKRRERDEAMATEEGRKRIEKEERLDAEIRLHRAQKLRDQTAEAITRGRLPDLMPHQRAALEADPIAAAQRATAE